MPPLQVLYEDNHLLVVDKPAGLATMGTQPDIPTLARQAAGYLKAKYHKPGNVFVGVVSRLDSLVSGIVVLARTSKAASRLSEQIRNRSTGKRYLALVEGSAPGSFGEWQELSDYVAKNEAEHRMVIVAKSHPRAQFAELRLRTLATASTVSLVEVELQTGRKHQIRLQLSAVGCPILGDRKYEARTSFVPGIALHSYQLTLFHPTGHQRLEFESMPRTWQAAHRQLWQQGMEVLRR